MKQNRIDHNHGALKTLDYATAKTSGALEKYLPGGTNFKKGTFNNLTNFSTTRAGEPEPERGAMEPANFKGPGAGAGAFLNISAEPELEPQKFY